jgi:hypothetical protein
MEASSAAASDSMIMPVRHGCSSGLGAGAGGGGLRLKVPTTEAHNSGLYSIGKIICRDFSESARADPSAAGMRAGTTMTQWQQCHGDSS